MDFQNANPQARNYLLQMLQGGGTQGYSPEARVAQFFKNFGAENLDPTTKAKAMELLMRGGINMPTYGGGNSGGMTLGGEAPNYPAPSPQY